MLEPLLESTPTETEMHAHPLTVCLRVELQTTRDLVAAADHYLAVDESSGHARLVAAGDDALGGGSGGGGGDGGGADGSEGRRGPAKRQVFMEPVVPKPCAQWKLWRRGRHGGSLLHQQLSRSLSISLLPLSLPPPFHHS